jgi:hypothetical protein
VSSRFLTIQWFRHPIIIALDLLRKLAKGQPGVRLTIEAEKAIWTLESKNGLQSVNGR